MVSNTEFNKTTKTDLYQIDPRLIKENEYNTRTDFGDIEELAASIEENGLLNPISVQQYKNEDGETRYVLVDGARRLRAVKMLLERGVNIYRVKAILIPKSLTEKELFIQHLVRNEGKSLNEMEYANAVYTMETKFGMTITEIAKALGKNVGCITYYKQHLDRPENERKLLGENKISGSNLRRIDRETTECTEEEKANIIKTLDEEREKEGKKTISLKNLKMVVKDSKIILSGILLLKKYANEFAQTHNGEIPKFSINEIADALKLKTITDFFEYKYKESHLAQTA